MHAYFIFANIANILYTIINIIVIKHVFELLCCNIIIQHIFELQIKNYLYFNVNEDIYKCMFQNQVVHYYSGNVFVWQIRGDRNNESYDSIIME